MFWQSHILEWSSVNAVVLKKKMKSQDAEAVALSAAPLPGEGPTHILLRPITMMLYLLRVYGLNRMFVSTSKDFHRGKRS